MSGAAAALFKAVVGTGIFALPPAMRACGLLLGTCVAVVMGIFSLFTTWAMIEAVREGRLPTAVGGSGRLNVRRSARAIRGARRLLGSENEANRAAVAELERRAFLHDGSDAGLQ